MFRLRPIFFIPLLILVAVAIYAVTTSPYSVQTRLADGSIVSQQMQLQLRIYNNSSTDLDMKTCQLVYQFTENTALANLNANVWWYSQSGTNDVQVAFTAGAGDARAFTMSFLNGTVPPGGYAEIQMGVHKSDWSNFDQSDDPSVPAGTTWAENNRVQMLVNGVAVWGPSNGSTAPSSVVQNSSAVNTSATSSAAIVVPVNAADLLSNVDGFGIWGTDGVWLADRAAGSGDGVSLYGDVGTNSYAEMGADSRIAGSLYAGDKAFLRSRAFLDGDLRVGSGYSAQDGITIKGKVNTFDPGANFVLQASDLTSQVGTTDVSVAPDGEYTLAPGAYNNLQVFSRSKLHLQSGTYTFRNFKLEPDVTLDLNVAGGSLKLNVLESFALADRTTMTWANNNVNPLAFQVYQQGTTDLNIGTDMKIAGRYLAPNAKIHLASRVQLAGWIQGKSVYIEPDTKVCEPPTLDMFTHSQIAYGPNFDPLQEEYTANVSTAVQSLQMYATAHGNTSLVSIAGGQPGDKIAIPSAGQRIILRVTDPSKGFIMSTCGEVQYALTVKPVANPVVRVMQGSQCTGTACDGSSWAKAYKDLATGLADARQQGKQLQVATGTYRLTGDRNATFQIGAGMDVRGGFSGLDGESVDARKGDINSIVLSGDINADDGTTWPPESRTNKNTADNAYHVVTMFGGHGLPYAQTLDRVNIQGGVADGTGSAGVGAGLLVVGAAPYIDYVIVQKNESKDGGAAIYANLADTLRLTNSYVVDNTVQAGKGGAFLLQNTNLVTVNDVVSKNSADEGAVIAADASSVFFTHITAAYNVSAKKAAWSFTGGSGGSMVNTIAWENLGASNTSAQVSLANSMVIWDHSDVQGALLNSAWNPAYGNDLTGNTGVDPNFSSIEPSGSDGLFYTKDDGFMLSDLSPLIDKGSAVANILADMFGVDRTISKDGSDRPDIGAHEWFPQIQKGFKFLYQKASGDFVYVDKPTVISSSASNYFPLKIINSPYAYIISATVANSKYLDDSHVVSVSILNGDGSSCSEQKNMTFYRVGTAKGLVEYRSYYNGKGVLTFLAQREMPSGSNYLVLKVCDPSNFKIQGVIND